MQILTFIHEYPPIGGGGGHVAQDVARGLVKLGHQVHVLAPHMRGLPWRTSDEGVDLIRIPSFRRKAFVGDLPAMSSYLLIGFFVSLWLIFRLRPHIIHVHFAVPAGFLARLLSRLTGIPYVLTSHLGDIPGGVPEKTDRWFKWIYPFTHRIWWDAAAVTAISDFTRQLALSHYPVEIKVIPNGIRKDKHLDETLEVNMHPQIVFAGRFVSQKNPALIPQVLDALRDLDWHCMMLGDGELMEHVIEQIEHCGLGERFTLAGWRPIEKVDEILSQSDILFLPSQTEGIPLTGLKSLANGLAIVSSNVGGMPQLVEHGKNGYLHAPSDLDGFATSLRTLLQDPDMLRKARLASLEIAKSFDIETIVKQYEEILFGARKK